MNVEQIQVVRDLLEYTRGLEQQMWGDDVEDETVIRAESMVIEALNDLEAAS